MRALRVEDDRMSGRRTRCLARRAVEVYVHGLRRKLGADLIQTVCGLGSVVTRE